MQDPDPKCRHFVISWHFMAFWHVCQKAECINKSAFSAFSRLSAFFRLSMSEIHIESDTCSRYYRPFKPSIQTGYLLSPCYSSPTELFANSVFRSSWCWFSVPLLPPSINPNFTLSEKIIFSHILQSPKLSSGWKLLYKCPTVHCFSTFPNIIKCCP